MALIFSPLYIVDRCLIYLPGLGAEQRLAYANRGTPSYLYIVPLINSTNSFCSKKSYVTVRTVDELTILDSRILLFQPRFLKLTFVITFISFRLTIPTIVRRRMPIRWIATALTNFTSNNHSILNPLEFS